VVNSHLVCDPTIRQPGFDLPRQLFQYSSTEWLQVSFIKVLSFLVVLWPKVCKTDGLTGWAVVVHCHLLSSVTFIPAVHSYVRWWWINVVIAWDGYKVCWFFCPFKDFSAAEEPTDVNYCIVVPPCLSCIFSNFGGEIPIGFQIWGQERSWEVDSIWLCRQPYHLFDHYYLGNGSLDHFMSMNTEDPCERSFQTV